MGQQPPSWDPYAQQDPRQQQTQPQYPPQQQPYGQQQPQDPSGQPDPGQWQWQPSWPDQQPRSPSFAPGPQYGTPPGQTAYQGQASYPRQQPYEQQTYPPGQPPHNQQAYYQGQAYGQQFRSPSGPQGWPPRTSWPRRHKVLTALGSLVALLIVIGAIGSATGKPRQAGNVSAAATSSMPTRTATPSRAPTHHATSTGTVPTRATTAPAAPATTAPAAPATSGPAAPAGPTVSQQQALDSAQSYLALGSGFSRQGLIHQLDSPYGGKFSVADATWAADHSGADWDAQAVLAAKGYMQLGGFSRASLIDQLDSPYGGKFTLAQATYAANQVGL